MHKVILLCLLFGANPQQQNLNSIPEGSRVYVVPSSWFEIEMVSALRTKNVPVVVVSARNSADFEIDAESDSDGGQWVRQKATITVRNLHSGAIIYAQKITKWASLHGTRSVAEACAKQLRNLIVTLPAEELSAFQSSPRFYDELSVSNPKVADTPDSERGAVSGTTVIDPGSGPSLGEIARQARSSKKQDIRTAEVENIKSDLPPVISPSQSMAPTPEPSKLAMLVSAASRHPWLTGLSIFALLWWWKSPNISIRVPLDRLFVRNTTQKSREATDTSNPGWSRTKQFYPSAEASGVVDEELFAILGVQPGCNAEQLRAAYLRRVKQWHTDRLEGMAPELREFANREVSRINEAYTKLSQHSRQSNS